MKTQCNEGEVVDEPDEVKKFTVTFSTVVQIVLCVTSTLLCVIVVPWGTWATQKIMSLEEFKNQGPRITGKDLDNLKMAVKAESMSDFNMRDVQINAKLDVISKGVDNLREQLIRHEAETRTMKTGGGT